MPWSSSQRKQPMLLPPRRTISRERPGRFWKSSESIRKEGDQGDAAPDSTIVEVLDLHLIRNPPRAPCEARVGSLLSTAIESDGRRAVKAALPFAGRYLVPRKSR